MQYSSANSIFRNSMMGGNGTPRFATEKEIEDEEMRMLLSFAFKDKKDEEKYRKEIFYIRNMIEPLIEKPSESQIKSLKAELRSIYYCINLYSGSE